MAYHELEVAGIRNSNAHESPIYMRKRLPSRAGLEEGGEGRGRARYSGDTCCVVRWYTGGSGGEWKA